MKLKVLKIFGLTTFFLSTQVLLAQDNIEFYFKDAQPKKEDVLTRFPMQVRGLYKSDKDTTRRLRITADSLSFEVPMVRYASINELASKNYSITDSTITSPSGKMYFSFTRLDTVYFVDYVQSVLFVQNETNVIKKIENHFILSKRLEEEKWECILLTLDQDKICIAYLDPDHKQKEISSNKKIDVVVENDTQQCKANLKKKEFIKLIDQGFFPRKQYFSKRFNWQ